MEKSENAWHNVKGVSLDALGRAQAEAERLYGDIIDLPHPVSKKHPPLSKEQKAAMYSPFAALTGYEAAIDETAEKAELRFEERR